MPSTINGQPTKPLPASVTNAIARGVPKRTALSTGAKPSSDVRVR